MRPGRHSRRRAKREIPYPLLQFGSLLAELIDADPRAQGTIAAALEVSATTLSSYRNGAYLPADESAVRAIAAELSPTEKERPALERELLERWRTDLWDADLRAKDQTVAATRAALDRVEAARKRQEKR